MKQRLLFQDSIDLTGIFRRLHEEIREDPAPEFEINFYPYAGLKHTIRSRSGKIFVRLSDLIRQAHFELFEATLAILICRLYSLPAPEDAQQVYVSYAASTRIRKASLEARAKRGSKRLTRAEGEFHDLNQLFAKLNSEYFDNQVHVQHLSWSPGSNKRVLGHYDRAHDAIVLNRTLDQPLVPGFVVEYVLYHEMLHATLGEEFRGNRRHIHHEQFRRAEQEFSDYSRARRFIHEELC